MHFECIAPILAVSNNAENWNVTVNLPINEKLSVFIENRAQRLRISGAAVQKSCGCLDFRRLTAAFDGCIQQSFCLVYPHSTKAIHCAWHQAAQIDLIVQKRAEVDRARGGSQK